MNKHFHTDTFQGHLEKKNYFEGWYFKQVSTKTKTTISFIPGISLNTKDPHAFVQVIATQPVRTFYFKFPLDVFDTTHAPFGVTIGNNVFSKSKIIIDLDDGTNKFKGNLAYGDLSPINRTFLEPNIMGAFSYLPYMACNHGILSMSHVVNGEITDEKGTTHTFDSDQGYIEKDWGRSFPERYIWLQANHFKAIKDSVMVSVATIPLLGTGFIGHIALLHVDGKAYRFATYNGSKVLRSEQIDQHVFVTLKRKKQRLELVATLTETGALKAPILGEMSDTIKEGLGGHLSYQLYENDQLIHSGESAYAGIESVKF